ncbi:aminoglycoside phosphotransferase family protein [Aliirhizobium smilacinae]|uniref:Aminoglycoside phosphotransferase family protein n=1 Tax=Aliirhizobium smilacinae TaxID=1395944 RepID=A0A5C4XSV4_9HYPH|nr:aminoglycoside phosphotransferase family protein [Rhizobium smilacinae]TNM65774.1 aminoglycoside phosphotransferase family protein [Rhizobium smilacinae]
MFDIDTGLVASLVADQFPQWAALPIRPVLESGWDNRTFHLGTDMSVRLPSAERYVAQITKEARWLPVLAPQLPLPVPVPLAVGRPAFGYPGQWAIYQWIDGETAKRERIGDLEDFANDLAEFLKALWVIDATGGPPAGVHNFHRGGPLSVYDRETRAALVELTDEVDASLLSDIWERALSSSWQGPPRWLHGDVTEGNLLVKNGKLSAVIDFGTCGVGDPSADLAISWTLFDAPARKAFESRLGLDRETWDRARGWCMWKALIVIAEHRHKDQVKSDIHRRWIERIVGNLA